jgi:hypothetical protein
VHRPPGRDGQQLETLAYFCVADDGADPIMVDVLGIKVEQIEGRPESRISRSSSAAIRRQHPAARARVPAARGESIPKARRFWSSTGFFASRD